MKKRYIDAKAMTDGVVNLYMKLAALHKEGKEIQVNIMIYYLYYQYLLKWKKKSMILLNHGNLI